MADLTAADRAFVADMTDRHREAIATAKEYLKAPGSQRRANLTEMANRIIEQRTGEMGQMRSMMTGTGSMMG